MQNSSTGRRLASLMSALVSLTAMLTLFTGTAEASAAERAPGSGNVCLTAPAQEVYAACEALRTQPVYDYVNDDGYVVGVNSGALLVDDLKLEGVTPDGTPERFRQEALALVRHYFSDKKGSPRGDGSTCLTAPDLRTYVACAALFEQPSYDRNDGSGLSAPTGSEIIAELSGEGITPAERPDDFRREARAEVEGYFQQFRA